MLERGKEIVVLRSSIRYTKRKLNFSFPSKQNLRRGQVSMAHLSIMMNLLNSFQNMRRDLLNSQFIEISYRLQYILFVKSVKLLKESHHSFIP